MADFPTTKRVYNETNLVSNYFTNVTHGKDMCQDGSVTPIEYTYSPPAGKDLLARRVIIYMEGSTAFDSNSFGDIPAPLPNGWELHINGSLAMIAHTNRELVSYMFKAHGSEIFGKVNRTMIADFELTDLTEDNTGITIENGSDIKIIVNDNLTPLVFLEVRVQGNLKTT